MSEIPRHHNRIIRIIVSTSRSVGSLVEDVAHESTRGVTRAIIAWSETDHDGDVVNVLGVALSAQVSA